MPRISLEITGLGLILYSPFAVKQIVDGEDYLTRYFEQPKDVAAHVRDCRLTTFCTGSPGRYHLDIQNAPLDENALAQAKFKLRLGLEVRDEVVCIRDLYDLLDWNPECSADQRIHVPDGWYRLTVYSSPPAAGRLGNDQEIVIHMERVLQKPVLNWTGVPQLCG